MGSHIRFVLGHIKPVKSNMPETKVEVTKGVFDPREYKKIDKENWARKRRSDWMAATGKIHYVRERTVASEEREMASDIEKKGQPKTEKECEEHIAEPMVND